MPFVIRVFVSDYSASYAMYDSSTSKIYDFIDSISFIILIISAYGIYKYHKYLYGLIFILVGPLLMFWLIQGLEDHHYYMFMFSMISFFTLGMYKLCKYKYVMIFIMFILMYQVFIILVPINSIDIGLTSTRKYPEINGYKQQIIDLRYFIDEQLEDDKSAYMISGDYTLNTDLIKNALLPMDISVNMYDNVLDLRDGLPSDIGDIDYIITTDPILYINKEYQYIYDLMNEVLYDVDLFKGMYDEYHRLNVAGNTVIVYKRWDEYTHEHYQYLYDKLIERYPDYEDKFRYIIEE